MKHLRTTFPVMMLFSALPFLAAGSMPPQDQTKPQTKPAKSTNPDRGQQVFEQNCSRCHNAPEGFSQHISGTIAQHMRVRAGLSDKDYEALRHFLNP